MGGTKLRMCLSKCHQCERTKERKLFSLFLACLTFKNSAPLWDYHRYRRKMLALEKKNMYGHYASSLIDHYQQHGGGARVERQLSVTTKTYKSLYVDITAQELR